MNTSACGASSRQRHTVLVVDADVVFREFEARTLSDRGYAVLKASGRKEALRLARQNDKIHLLLASFSIHEPDTLELTQQFQRAHPGAAILLVLGPFEVFDERCNTLGRIGVMTKPFVLNELINNVHRLLAEVAPIPSNDHKEEEYNRAHRIPFRVKSPQSP